MKTLTWVLVGVVACLLVAAGSFLWATGLMDSMYAYRSPLHAKAPAPGQPLAASGQSVTRRVVFVLIDALREDTSRNSEVMPFLNELRDQGAWATMHSRPPSYSEPGYTVLLTGAWPGLSDGPTINLDYDQIPTFTQDNLFSAAHRQGLKTAISGYNWFEKLVPQEAVDASFYTPGEDKTADREVVNAALPWLQQGGYQLILIHIDQVDYAGHHEGGPRSPNWDAAARRADDLLREIAAPLDLSQDTLFVCSDHGQIDRGGHGGQDPITLIEPFVLVGAGVNPGKYGDVQMVDVAPTLAALLGTNIPASSQGHVRTAMLRLPQAWLEKLPPALKTQQSQLLADYESAIGRDVPAGAGPDVVASTQSAMEAALQARLRAERLPRAVIALLALAALLFGAYAIRKLDPAWLLGGALLYVFLFNFRYAVLDGRTYSLSSVASAGDLISYCAITAFLAMLLAWLATALGLGLFRSTPLRAVEISLALTFVIDGVLLLPVLWSFVWNGALVTWALPDFASMFLAFLSLVQILLVSVVGLLLAGIAAALAAFVHQRKKEEVVATSS